MAINHNNIEEYLLDYLEGNLDPLLTAELMAFLAENPEYEGYIAYRNLHSLTLAGVRFPDAHFLKKDFSDVPVINETNFDEFCIAASEGMLNPSDVERLNIYMGEDSLKIKNLELFKSLKLKPNLKETFPDKSKLKKNRGLILPVRYLYYGLAVAASISLILLLSVNRQAVVIPAGSGNVLSENNTLSTTVQNNRVENTEPLNQPGTAPSPSVSKAVNVTQTIDVPTVESSDLAYVEPDLEVLQPVSGIIPAPVINKELPSLGTITEIPLPRNRPERTVRIESENLFADLFSKINFWKTAENAISGFNYLTEANISIGKTTDEDGRLTRLTLNTESYSIQGKLK